MYPQMCFYYINIMLIDYFKKKTLKTLCHELLKLKNITVSFYISPIYFPILSTYMFKYFVSKAT